MGEAMKNKTKKGASIRGEVERNDLDRVLGRLDAIPTTKTMLLSHSCHDELLALCRRDPVDETVLFEKKKV